jgi:aldehyde dehydrogenase (NAD+)
MTAQEILDRLGLAEDNSGVFAGEWLDASGDTVEVPNPTSGETIARVTMASRDDYEKVVASSVETFERWRTLPAPKRGEYIRRLGNALRENVDDLGPSSRWRWGRSSPRASVRSRR